MQEDPKRPGWPKGTESFAEDYTPTAPKKTTAPKPAPSKNFDENEINRTILGINDPGVRQNARKDRGDKPPAFKPAPNKAPAPAPKPSKKPSGKGPIQRFVQDLHGVRGRLDADHHAGIPASVSSSVRKRASAVGRSLSRTLKGAGLHKSWRGLMTHEGAAHPMSLMKASHGKLPKWVGSVNAKKSSVNKKTGKISLTDDLWRAYQVHSIATLAHKFAKTRRIDAHHVDPFTKIMSRLKEAHNHFRKNDKDYAIKKGFDEVVMAAAITVPPWLDAPRQKMLSTYDAAAPSGAGALLKALVKGLTKGKKAPLPLPSVGPEGKDPNAKTKKPGPGTKKKPASRWDADAVAHYRQHPEDYNKANWPENHEDYHPGEHDEKRGTEGHIANPSHPSHEEYNRLHPHAKAGAAEGKGGQFVKTDEGGSGTEPSPSDNTPTDEGEATQTRGKKKTKPKFTAEQEKARAVDAVTAQKDALGPVVEQDEKYPHSVGVAKEVNLGLLSRFRTKLNMDENQFYDLCNELAGPEGLKKNVHGKGIFGTKEYDKVYERLDVLLKAFPLAGQDEEQTKEFHAMASGSTETHIPPYGLLAMLKDDGTVAIDKLNKLSKGQIEDANHGMEAAKQFRDLYTNKEKPLDIEITGLLLLWSILSRGVAPYVQESLFIDAFEKGKYWIDKAQRGEFTEADLYGASKVDKNGVEQGEWVKGKKGEAEYVWRADRVDGDYLKWCKTVAPALSGQPGAGAGHNLAAFGKSLLLKLGKKVNGKDITGLQHIHDMMSDKDMTGQKLRREFHKLGGGVGIDNKVVSFTALVAGFTDVVVLDRVMTKAFFDDGRFKGLNLYDGESGGKKGPQGFDDNGHVKGKITGSALHKILDGPNGLAVYESMEQAIAKNLEKIYSKMKIKRPGFSLGRFHWENWVAASGQEASHGTLGALQAKAADATAPIKNVMAKQGEYGSYYYGAHYHRSDDKGTARVSWRVPSTNKNDPPGKMTDRFIHFPDLVSWQAFQTKIKANNGKNFLDKDKKIDNGAGKENKSFLVTSPPESHKGENGEDLPWYFRNEVDLTKVIDIAEEEAHPDRKGEGYGKQEKKNKKDREAKERSDARKQKASERIRGKTDTYKQYRDREKRVERLIAEAKAAAKLAADAKKAAGGKGTKPPVLDPVAEQLTKALGLSSCDALLPLARAASVVPLLRPAKLVALSSVGSSREPMPRPASFAPPEEVAEAAIAGVAYCASAECSEEIDADGTILFLAAKLAARVSITAADLEVMHTLFATHSKGGAVYRLLGGDLGREWCDSMCMRLKKKGIAEQQQFDEEQHPRGGDQQHPGRFSAGHGSKAPEHSDEAAEHGHEAIKYEASKPGPRTMQDLIGTAEEQNPADLDRANKEAMEEIGRLHGAKWGDQEASDEDLAHLFGGKTPSTKIKGSFVETAKQKKKREAFIASFGPEYEEDRASVMTAHRAGELRLAKEAAKLTVLRDTLEKRAQFEKRQLNKITNGTIEEVKAYNDRLSSYENDIQSFSDTPLELNDKHMEVLKDFCRGEVAEINKKHGISPEAEDEARGNFHATGFQFPDNLMTREGQQLFGRVLGDINLDKTGADIDLFQKNRIRAMEFLGAAANMVLYGKTLSIPLASMKSSFRSAALGTMHGTIGGLALGVLNPLQVFAHESGHILEKSDNWDNEGTDRAKKFLKRRGIAVGMSGMLGGGEKQVPLSSVLPNTAYGASETGAKDKFDETWAALGFSPEKSMSVGYYTGKLYRDNSTETMSMGMEMLVEAPKELATADPEYFHYVIDGLSGRGSPKAMKNLGYWAKAREADKQAIA